MFSGPCITVLQFAEVTQCAFNMLPLIKHVDSAEQSDLVRSGLKRVVKYTVSHVSLTAVPVFVVSR